MQEDLQSYLTKVRNRVPGLQAILVSDRDGIPLLKVSTSSNDDTKETTLLAATFAISSEQASKLKMGKNKSITTFWNNRVIVHLSHLPVIITCIGDTNLNVGLLHSFANDLKIALDPLRQSVVETEKLQQQHLHS